MCSLLYLSMAVISTEPGQLAMIFSCCFKYGKCRRWWVLRSGFWRWGLQVRNCRPSTGNVTASFRSSLTLLNLQKTSVIPVTCKTGNKDFFKLLTAHFFYYLMQVPWGMGTVGLLFISTVPEPLTAVIEVSMHRNKQRVLILSLFCPPSISNAYSYSFIHTPVTQTCTSTNLVTNCSLVSEECGRGAPLCTTCSCTIKSLVTTFGNDKSCYIK